MTNTTTENDTHLSDTDREIYGRLADQLIPPGPDMPSATQAEVPSRWIDEALRIRPDLARDMRVAIQVGTGAAAPEALALLHAEHSDVFDSLGTLTAGAYFLNPEVRRLIGYPGQVSIPIREDVDSYIDMLANVVERGQVYRSVPGS
jgi:hypothetical protein